MTETGTRATVGTWREELPASSPFVAAARHWIAHRLGGSPLSFDVIQIVSELATNAVRYGRGLTFQVELDVCDNGVRVAITDAGSKTRPHVLPPDPTREGGQGLLVVAALAERWGVEEYPDGRRTVWAELGAEVPS